MIDINQLRPGTEFIGNVNKMRMRIVSVEEGNCLIQNLVTQRFFSYGLQALAHCEITIMKEGRCGEKLL